MQGFALLGVGLVLAVPVAIGILFWKQRKLGQRLDIYCRQNDALYRELVELERQLADLVRAAMLPSRAAPTIEKEVHRTVLEPPLGISHPAVIEKPATSEKPVPLANHAETRRVVAESPIPETPVVAELLAPQATKPEVPVTLFLRPATSPPVAMAAAASEMEGQFSSSRGTVHARAIEKCPTGPAALKPAATAPEELPRTEEQIRARGDEIPLAQEAQPGSPVAMLAPAPRVVEEPAAPNTPVITEPLAPRWMEPLVPFRLLLPPASSVPAVEAAGASETEPPLTEELIRAWQDEVPPAREAQPNSRVATPAAEPMAAQAAASLIEAPAVSETRAAAPVAEPPQLAAITAASTASPERRVNSVFSLEETYGRNWPYKLGITLLAIGIVNFWIYELGHAAPVRIVLISYVVATVLLAGGIFLERRERQRIPGHTLIGGGWALLFFTTYALGHVDAMRVMKWETADLVLMLAVASGMVVHTLRYRSQLVTALCFLLGYSTVALSHDTVYSLAAGVVLAIGLVSIVLRMRWFDLELFGILSSYLTLSYSLQGIFRPVGAQGHSFRDYLASTSVLFSYWTTFRVSYIVRRIQSSAEETISTIAALLNTFLLLGAMKFQSVHPELAFDVLLAIGAAELTIAQLPVTKHRRRAFVLLTALGTALMAAAVPLRYSANDVAILWLVGALVLLLAGTIFDEIVFRRLGQFAGLLVALQLAANGLRQVMAPR